MNNSIFISKAKINLLKLEELKSTKETIKILSISGAKKSIVKGLKEAREGKGISIDKLK